MTLASLAAALALPAWAAMGADRIIQIGIVPFADEVSLAVEGRFTVSDADGGTHALFANKRYRVEPNGKKGMKLGQIRLPDEARLVPEGPEDLVDVEGKRYPGTLLLRRNPDGSVTAINEIGIEDYLRGVLPLEMDTGWPLEALKAQAVVARTFAYTQMGKYRKAGFDLTADTRSQVYGGIGEDAASIRRAVNETRGEVLGYKGEILNVYYHACCGGHTTDASSVWGGEGSKPLRGVRDKYCDRSPLSKWNAAFTLDALKAALERGHLPGGRLRRFEIGKKDIVGYVKTFLIKMGDESRAVKAADLRKWLGNSSIKSLRISRIKKSGDDITMFGMGSGHGVGLCQWGARLQAEQGRKYETILKFYFPGSTLSVIDE
jgi:stage II sporulation protein D